MKRAPRLAASIRCQRWAYRYGLVSIVRSDGRNEKRKPSVPGGELNGVRLAPCVLAPCVQAAASSNLFWLLGQKSGELEASR